MDSIIDIVGGVAGLEAMGIERIHCSALHVGSGTVNCAHGTLPVPAPATLELIKGKPVYSTGVVGELLTPTGAAILTTLAVTFGPMPAMTVEKTGYGSGEKDPAIANLLRISIGESQEDIAPFASERVAVVETNIDDMNPQVYDYLMEKLPDIGVLDILLVPAQMKKNRPGTMVKNHLPPRPGAENRRPSHPGNHLHRAALENRTAIHRQKTNRNRGNCIGPHQLQGSHIGKRRNAENLSGIRGLQTGRYRQKGTHQGGYGECASRRF